MNDPLPAITESEVTFISRYRFLLLIVISIVISFILVSISLAMYNSNGAAQLDLSRPGYQDVRSQAVTSDSDLQDFPSTGSISQTTISEFKLIYAGQAQKVNAVDAFGGDPLSPEALGLDIVTTE